MNGCKAAPAAKLRLLCLSHTIPRYLNRWLRICSFVPIQHHVLFSVTQDLEDGHKMLGHLTVV